MTYIDYINTSIKLDGSIKRAVFLDRDGTIHIDKVNTHKIEDLEYFSDTFSSIKKIYDMGYIMIIISNQDGIKKGLYSVKTMHIFNQKIIDDFKSHGVEIAAIYYAPYLPSDNDESFKPNPGMIIKAKEDFNIDLAKSYLIGDQLSDIKAGRKVGVTSLLVKTGIYKTPIEKDKEYIHIKDKVFASLEDASNYILNK